MRIGGRLAAAIEVINDIETRNRPAADAMREWGLAHRFAGSGDRAAIGNLVYDALRRRVQAQWMFDADSPRAMVLGAYLIEMGLDLSALDAVLAQDSFAPSALDNAERATVTARLAEEMPDTVQAGAPDWCLAMLQAGFGDDWVKECAAFGDRPPLDLRVNTLKVGRKSVLAALADFSAQATPLAPAGIRIPPIEGQGRHPNVQQDKAFLDGRFEVQDEGSQVVAHLAGAEPGMQVLDYCAGAGGKSLAMAAMMGNRGQIHCYDADPQRLKPIHDRLKRAGVRNVQTIGSAERLSTMEGVFDLVLVDAPCTGSGTWRRRPDAKWRLGEVQLETRLSEQAQILDDAARLVRPGGRLVYVTCSIFPTENEEQIAAFLSRHEGFSTVDHRALWDATFAGQDACRFAGENLGISLTPAISGTDGFFFASLRRAEI